MTPREVPVEVTIDGRRILGSDTGGDGQPIILLHGLTATRRYVVHGASTLARAGYRVVSYDSRGHGESDPAPTETAYAYEDLLGDLIAVMDQLAIQRAILVGHSMGGHLAAAAVIAAPERVERLVLCAPAHLGRPSDDLERWDRLADGLATGGPEGFWDAYDAQGDPEWIARVRTVVIQRLQRHRTPSAVVQALRFTPRSAAFNGLDALATISCPTLVVGSGDDFDPDHPLAVATQYRERIAGARFAIEGPGETPLTWRGAALSKEILAFLDATGSRPEPK